MRHKSIPSLSNRSFSEVIDERGLTAHDASDEVKEILNTPENWSLVETNTYWCQWGRVDETIVVQEKQIRAIYSACLGGGEDHFVVSTITLSQLADTIDYFSRVIEDAPSTESIRYLEKALTPVYIPPAPPTQSFYQDETGIPTDIY